MSLPAGLRLGPYELVGQLGAGGMGEVYRARDTRLQRTVAIKVLPEKHAAGPAARERFEREAKAISQLSHPHICALYDVGRHEGLDYLVLEFLEGETLASRLARGPLPIDETMRFGSQIAAALGTAHRNGIVHRDLKPGNVMLTRSGVKLLDFGLARAVPGSGAPADRGSSQAATRTELTQEGTIPGTVPYMAPEQIEGGTIDARTDIFALGAVLYEMVTGKRAFEGKSTASLMAAILERDPAPLAEVRLESPAALDHLVRVCLAKTPDDRWQSADDVSRELAWIARGGRETLARRTDSRRSI
ncbi:MAG TPA: serine/threonine-protein kinase, partial [Candidatus Polarisedimenticolia bacterium]|nr:serine/threonine-protein kinase [Candidatus Polarisedimenticolia bacterium]